MRFSPVFGGWQGIYTALALEAACENAWFYVLGVDNVGTNGVSNDTCALSAPVNGQTIGCWAKLAALIYT
jgi:hypothetical protein